MENEKKPETPETLVEKIVNRVGPVLLGVTVAVLISKLISALEGAIKRSV